MPEKLPTCWGPADPVDAEYHDREWGFPCHDDRQLFERLMLEAFQAGLSWSSILRRREGFAAAFHDWDPDVIADYGPADAERLMADARVIRNRAKIAAATRNAQAFLALQREHGSFDRFIWSFAPSPAAPPPVSFAEVPAQTAESAALSKALKAAGMTFVGPTICYALMQSIGMVNDHLASCPIRPRAAGA